MLMDLKNTHFAQRKGTTEHSTFYIYFSCNLEGTIFPKMKRTHLDKNKANAGILKYLAYVAGT